MKRAVYPPGVASEHAPLPHPGSSRGGPRRVARERRARGGGAGVPVRLVRRIRGRPHTPTPCERRVPAAQKLAALPQTRRTHGRDCARFPPRLNERREPEVRTAIAASPIANFGFKAALAS